MWVAGLLQEETHSVDYMIDSTAAGDPRRWSSTPENISRSKHQSRGGMALTLQQAQAMTGALSQSCTSPGDTKKNDEMHFVHFEHILP